MKLSMWSSYYIDLSPEEAILEIAGNKWKYTELSDEHGAVLLERGAADKVGRDFGAFCRNEGVLPEQGHLWLAVPLCAPKERNVVGILKNWLDLYAAAGIKTGVLHCDSYSFPEKTTHEAKVEANAKVIRELTEYLKGTDFVISLENLPTGPKIAPTVADSDQLLEVINMAGGGPNLGICLDTGHLNLVENRDQEAFIRKAGGLLKALHLADNDMSRDQHLMPFGLGSVDFIKVIRTAKEIGYNGLYNLEIPGERRAPLEVRAMKLDYLARLFDYLDAEA